MFAPDGQYLRTVGGKGQGPMEFGAVQLSHVDSDGTVHALDGVNARETLIGSDFELVDTRSFGGMFNDFEHLSEGRYVVQTRVNTADGIGLPLHIIDNRGVLHSFGAVAGSRGDPVVTNITLRRRLAVSPDGLIFSAKAHAYQIEAWDQDGQRRGGFQGPQLNEQQPKPGPFSRDNPYVSRVSAVGVDDSGLLWIGIWQLRSDWQDRVVEVMTPAGTLHLRAADGLTTSIYTSRIEVVDLSRMAVRASHERDGLIVRFLEGRRAVALQYGQEGNVRLAVLDMKLDP